LEPIPRGDLPSQDEIKGILHELARFNFFKRELPTFPVSFPQKAPTQKPFDVYHVPTGILTPRDLEYKNERNVPIPPRDDQTSALMLQKG